MAGRPKGSLGRQSLQLAFVAKVEKYMALASGDKSYSTDGLAREAARLMTDGDDKTRAFMVATLIKYKVGLPTQPVEHSGEVSLVDRVKAMRERAALAEGGKEVVIEQATSRIQ